MTGFSRKIYQIANGKNPTPNGAFLNFLPAGSAPKYNITDLRGRESLKKRLPTPLVDLCNGRLATGFFLFFLQDCN